MRHVTNARASVRIGRVDLSPEQHRLSFSRRQEPGQHLRRRRLAAAIGADEAEDLTPLDIKIDVVNGGEVAEPAGQITRNDHQLVMSLKPSAGYAGRDDQR